MEALGDKLPLTVVSYLGVAFLFLEFSGLPFIFFFRVEFYNFSDNPFPPFLMERRAPMPFQSTTFPEASVHCFCNLNKM